MKTIVYFYSHKGSNRYLANKIAKEINCPIEEIKPRLNSHLLMLMSVNFGNIKLKSRMEEYDRAILCGPIWMGKLIVPLRNFIELNKNKFQNLIFVTCCGSTFKKKDEKFGHNFVFKEVRNILQNKCKHCEAFPKALVLPDELKDAPDAFMKTNLNDENFKGEIQTIYDKFISSFVKS